MWFSKDPIVELVLDAPSEKWIDDGYWISMFGGEKSIRILCINHYGEVYPAGSTWFGDKLTESHKIKAKYKALKLHFIRKALGT